MNLGISKLNASFYQLKFYWALIRYSMDPSAAAVEKAVLVIQKLRQSQPNNRTTAVEILDHVALDPKAKMLISDRYGLEKVFTLQELETFPEDSLGFALFQHLSKNNLKVNIHAVFKVNSDLEYISFRSSQLHDFWHVLLDKGVSHLDEFCVQAFTFAQTKSPLLGFFLAGDIIYSAKKGPRFLYAAISAIALGFNIGGDCKSVFGFPWEDNLATPLQAVRNHFFSISNKTYSWYSPTKTTESVSCMS